MNKGNKTKQFSPDCSFGALKNTKAPSDNVLSMRDQREQKRDIADRDLYKRIVSRTKHL